VVSINWPAKIINVAIADLTPIATGIYALDIDTFRLILKDLEDDATGMPFPDTHRHQTTTTIGGVTLARLVEIINGYTITFENGTYAVNLVGANSNISDVSNVNSVSIRSSNSAGLVQVSTGSGGADADLAARALADGRYEIDYTASTATQYNPDGTVRTVFDLQDADGNPATSGQTAVKRVPQ
jgi:hypothetical protein